MTGPLREPSLGAEGTTAYLASLIDRAYAMRDRLLESPLFQRLSSSFPLTRWIARKEARALFDLCAGFVYSQILVACVQLDLFRKLRVGPKTAAELSRELSIPEEAMERLLLGAVSLRLLAKRGKGRFGLGMLGAALNGNAGISAMVAHHALLYRDLEDPVALLRGAKGETHLARYWSYARSEQPSTLQAEDVGAYSQLMASSQQLVARDILDAYPFASHRCVLDVGGGEGEFLIAAASRYPSLRFMLFDLPAVVERAHHRVANANLSGRVAVHGGSFNTGALPRGADLITLVRVLHDHDDGDAAKLLRSAFDALPPGGTLLVAEPMAGVPGGEPIGDAYFGMYLYAMGSGRPRTEAEVSAMLKAAGFSRVVRCSTRQPMLLKIVRGERP